ncbi:CHD3-type chromatin-remodeling factor PICKLE isoform X1 [Senna tora]|uniref:CHD3-type chromatin-remodeling factor PICKLE isoform X1 n=1 Tax=Senna tora TaxID=362788 RepID=A0A834T8Z4_9FABA|nr:CHD3-type chromatin-remodeling factor PICKLE isoform X1 [Senna tora]
MTMWSGYTLPTHQAQMAFARGGVKKDVMKELPPKKELILRVELSSKQKEYYKAILTRNYQILTRRGGAQTAAGIIGKVAINWLYERIDGKVGGAERQVRIDRFNAKNSSRFCFLLSTRAGGLGINLATADTVIIYDSDWNPHADLQAMARAHRLGQTNKVMIYRLITRGSIEERMMQMTKKKMVLEHLVVGRLKAQNINQEELDDIIRYGSKELFADENDEAGKSRQIHYDDAAIDRLLDREQIDDEEATMDEEEDGFLKAFKVANFEYIDEVEAAAEEAARKRAMENTTTVANTERTKYWEELLGDRYEVHKVEELNALGKGKRSRQKQMVSVEEDDLAGLEDVSSDGDDNYEVELTDGDANSTGIISRRPYKKRARAADSTEPLPLMEGEGKSFRVRGFNQSQRAAFVQILMRVCYRFGAGDYDWKEFASRMKQKTYEEIREYGILFLTHISEEVTEAPTFSDGVPKEGLRVQDVLIRIAVLSLITKKVKFASENPGTPLFSDDILFRYPSLKGTKIWKEEHDLVLLRAVLKHGYGRWQAIVDDKDLKIQEVICQELNLPFINLPVPGQVSSQAQNGASLSNAEVPSNQCRENGGSETPADGALGSGDVRNQTHLYQDSSILYHFRDMQRRQVEFIKKRVLLLEKGINVEYQQECLGEMKANEVTNDGLKYEAKPTNIPSFKSGETDSQMLDQLPQVEAIASDEISLADSDPKRLELVRLYNEMCKVLNENSMDLIPTSLARETAEADAVKNFPKLQTICEDTNRILTPSQKSHPTEEKPLIPENKSEASQQGEVMVSQDDCKSKSVDTERKDVLIDSEHKKESSTGLVKEKETTSPLETKVSDIEMDDADNDAELNEKAEKSEPGVI